MNAPIKYPVAIVSVFLWIGFVGAISFMEAWLKFRAPGVTLPIGLSIGRLVFNVLNKVEWVFVCAIGINLIGWGSLSIKKTIALYLAIVLLLLQTFWLLPGLDTQAAMHIEGQSVPPSHLHIYYVVAEILKVVALFIFGIRLFKI